MIRTFPQVRRRRVQARRPPRGSNEKWTETVLLGRRMVLRDPAGHEDDKITISDAEAVVIRQLMDRFLVSNWVPPLPAAVQSR